MSQILEIPSEGIRRKALVETVEKSRPSFHAASQVSAGPGEETAENEGKYVGHRSVPAYDIPHADDRLGSVRESDTYVRRASRVDGAQRIHPGVIGRSQDGVPLVTCEDIAYADDDDFGVFEGLLSVLLSVLMIYGYVFILAVIFWNAHPISHWLYNHAQQLMEVIR